MARLLYSATMSLDGFIAGPGGDMSWLTAHLQPDPAVDEVVRQVGALLVGNRTFRGDDPHKGSAKEGAFEGAWEGPQVVLTHDTSAAPVPGVTYAGDLHTGVALAKQAAGDRYVNVLGADTARQCIEAGLLDEVLVFVAPVLLGDGVRLFDHPGGHLVTLEPVDRVLPSRVTSLWLRVAGRRPD